jgi:C_GCAxxG_C_C family probable redox protein
MMKERTNKAVSIYKQGFNCSQSVFASFADPAVMNDEAMLKIGTVFGAGVSCTGNHLCGAVTGGLMAISLKHGRGDLASLDAKAKTFELGQKFMNEFKSRIGSCNCEKIIGYNIGIKANMERARAEKVFETKCLDAVRTAAELLEPII